MKRLFLVCSLVLFSAGENGADEENPLKPADISSPRATLASFTANCEKVYQILQKEGVSL